MCNYLKQILLLTFFCILFLLPCLGQKKELHKLFEFGLMTCDEMTEQIDRLEIALGKEPDTNAYIIFYSGLYSSTQRIGKVKKPILIDHRAFGFVRFISNQLTYRKLDKTKVEIKDGGYRDRVLFEVWLVPKGASPPMPEPTVNPKDPRFKNIKVIKKTPFCSNF